MKQKNMNKSALPTQSTAQKIAQEFSRIAQLSQGGDRDEAWSAANNLYADHPNDATANFIIALMLTENRQKADALPYAEVAVKYAPNNVRNLVFLGKLYVDLGMIEYAPAVLHKAFNIDNTAYQAPWALARFHFEFGQGNRALPYFDLALKAAPSTVLPEIRIARADCLRALARVDEAEADYNNLSSFPQYRTRCLVGAALLKKHNQTSDHAERIQDELGDPALSARDRSSLLLTLGRLYENGGDFDNAFQKFEEFGRILKSRFNSDEFNSQLNDNVKVLTKDAFRRFAGFGHQSHKPIFVVGMPRSGTTLTEQIIASHSQAEGVGELDRMSRMAASFSSRLGMQEVLDKMKEVGAEQWKNAPLQYLNLINALAPDARHTVDKMPHNFMSLGFIYLCFPNAKIIHCRRNPLDNFISAFQNPMTLFHGYSFDQITYGEYYVKYLKLMKHWQSAIPAKIHELPYESLVANPEEEVRKLLDYLGLPWEDACLKFNERESTVRTFSQMQVRAPIGTGSVGRWKRYEKHLDPISSVLREAQVEF